MVSAALTTRAQGALATIRADIRVDVARRDGMPFSGSTVGEALGEICAQIDALAGILQAILIELGEQS